MGKKGLFWISKKLLAMILVFVVMGGAIAEMNGESMKEAMIEEKHTFDMFLNDPEIAAGSYASNRNKYHYIYQMGLSGPGLTVWDYATGKGIKAAVIDTGANVDHKDLEANVKGAYNAIDEQTGTTYVTDNVGHGSMCAGILGGSGNNGFGASGVAPEVNLYIVKSGDTYGAYTTDVAKGIRWAVDQGCRVISISSGSDQGDSYEEDAIAYAVNHDVVVVCSGGNDKNQSVRYPAAYEGVIGVSALNYDASTGYTISNGCRGKHIDVAAPGSGLYGVSNTSDTALAPGGATSAATPYVAGVAALVLSADPTLSAAECAQIIMDTATDAGAPGYDTAYGYGIINPLAAVQRAKLKQTSINRSISGVASSYSKNLSAGTFQLNPFTEGSGVFTYSSSNPSVAAVDGNGKVTLKKVGTTTITVSIGLSGIYQPASVITKLTVTGVTSSDKKQSSTAKGNGLKKGKITKLKAGKKSLTIRWEREKKADGYQIQIARNKKFTKGKKTVYINKNKKTKKVFSKLKKNQKYFVKVRAFTKSGGTKKYGKFSKVKSIKVK